VTPRAPAPRSAGIETREELPTAGLRLRALVLAAGLGTRLRPLTERTPKPLLPVLGHSILEHTLGRLVAVGCEETAINLHYLGKQIRSALGPAFLGMPLTYSEEQEPLGTLGAFPPLRDFFEPADLILLINGDSLCRWPLDRLLRRHLRGDSAATLLLATRPDPASFGGGVAIDRKGAILGFRRSDPLPRPAARRCVFAGAHVFGPALVAGIRPGYSDIVRDLYMPLLAAGERIQGVLTPQPWHDLGTPRRYLEAVLDWGRSPRRSKEGILFRGRETRIAEGAKLRASVLESGVEIGSAARLERTVVLSGARVGRGSYLREVVVGPEVVLPAETRLEECLVVSREGTPLGFSTAPLDPP